VAPDERQSEATNPAYVGTGRLKDGAFVLQEEARGLSAAGVNLTE
jgi:hypothetical protein